MGKAICKSLEEAERIYLKMKELPDTLVEQDGKVVYVSYCPSEYTSNKTEQETIVYIKKTLSLVEGHSYFHLF